MCQWLHIIIHECVSGSRISSLSASMAPDFHPYRRQWLQIAIPGYCKGSMEGPANLLPTGAIDANRDENLEPLTPIGMKLRSQ